jgi:molecular chaperone IbpA
MTRLTTLDLPTFARATVGFDRMFEELGREFANSKSSGYPPYNVVQDNEDEYTISLAIAGFSMEDLDITLEKNVLTIEGTSPDTPDPLTYLHRGIGNRGCTYRS